ncbi:hypothetical protein SynWH8103_00490 [Synechococcus sp. WH 8103]|nr:hypothetical protein SynWH8103_00490 [Synechococcus sp. WH 8103]
MQAETTLVSSRMGFVESDAGKQLSYTISSVEAFCRMM